MCITVQISFRLLDEKPQEPQLFSSQMAAL